MGLFSGSWTRVFCLEEDFVLVFVLFAVFLALLPLFLLEVELDFEEDFAVLFFLLAVVDSLFFAMRSDLLYHAEIKESQLK